MADYLLIRHFADGHEESSDYTSSPKLIFVGQTLDKDWKIVEGPTKVEGEQRLVIVAEQQT